MDLAFGHLLVGACFMLGMGVWLLKGNYACVFSGLLVAECEVLFVGVLGAGDVRFGDF